jgi:hypothetical protein
MGGIVPPIREQWGSLNGVWTGPVFSWSQDAGADRIARMIDSRVRRPASGRRWRSPGRPCAESRVILGHGAVPAGLGIDALCVRGRYVVEDQYEHAFSAALFGARLNGALGVPEIARAACANAAPIRA